MINTTNSNADSGLQEPCWLGLTEREREVVVLMLRGFSNRQIADRLGIRFYTATTHLKNIYKKLGVRRRAAAAAKVLAAKYSDHEPAPVPSRRWLLAATENNLNNANYVNS